MRSTRTPNGRPRTLGGIMADDGLWAVIDALEARQRLAGSTAPRYRLIRAALQRGLEGLTADMHAGVDVRALIDGKDASQD